VGLLHGRPLGCKQAPEELNATKALGDTQELEATEGTAGLEGAKAPEAELDGAKVLDDRALSGAQVLGSLLDEQAVLAAWRGYLFQLLVKDPTRASKQQLMKRKKRTCTGLGLPSACFFLKGGCFVTVWRGYPFLP
jgi:hypothetical protein